MCVRARGDPNLAVHVQRCEEERRRAAQLQKAGLREPGAEASAAAAEMAARAEELRERADAVRAQAAKHRDEGEHADAQSAAATTEVQQLRKAAANASVRTPACPRANVFVQSANASVRTPVCPLCVRARRHLHLTPLRMCSSS
jgi:chromosome segregation ATPase